MVTRRRRSARRPRHALGWSTSPAAIRKALIEVGRATPAQAEEIMRGMMPVLRELERDVRAVERARLEPDGPCKACGARHFRIVGDGTRLECAACGWDAGRPPSG